MPTTIRRRIEQLAAAGALALLPVVLTPLPAMAAQAEECGSYQTVDAGDGFVFYVLVGLQGADGAAAYAVVWEESNGVDGLQCHWDEDIGPDSEYAIGVYPPPVPAPGQQCSWQPPLYGLGLDYLLGEICWSLSR